VPQVGFRHSWSKYHRIGFGHSWSSRRSGLRYTAPRLADDGRAIEAGSAQIPDGTSSSSYSDEIQTVSANSESV